MYIFKNGHKYAKNPQLEVEDPGSEVLEENHKGGKDEQGIRIGAKENHHKLRVLELELSGCYRTRDV